MADVIYMESERDDLSTRGKVSLESILLTLFCTSNDDLSENLRIKLFVNSRSMIYAYIELRVIPKVFIGKLV